MSNILRVLGIDLASRSWNDNGSAILEFQIEDPPRWVKVECGCVTWPRTDLTPTAMADEIERIVMERSISAVSLDGPQGWREPNAGKRDGVGRICEFEAKCQGKTGELGKTYPQTQVKWIRFCIDVFSELQKRENAQIANWPEQCTAQRLGKGKYWLLECFPTSTWRTSRLTKLPGKAKVGKQFDVIAAYAQSLAQRYLLPDVTPWQGSHDDLQAVVAALPAAGLLGGPCRPLPRGKPGRYEEHGETRTPHWVEGIIWDGTLSDERLTETVDLPAATAIVRRDRHNSDADNPLLIDDRDDGGEDLLNRGVALYRLLLSLANKGESIGVGYAQFVCLVHQRKDFMEVANRRYAQCDTTHVLGLAHQITEADGGLKTVTKNGVTIEIGLDAFIWQKKPPHRRSTRAFLAATYSEQAWNAVFPNDTRQLLANSCDSIEAAGTFPVRTTVQ